MGVKLLQCNDCSSSYVSLFYNHTIIFFPCCSISHLLVRTVLLSSVLQLDSAPNAFVTQG